MSITVYARDPYDEGEAGVMIRVSSNMLEAGYDIESVSRITGLTPERIIELMCEKRKREIERIEMALEMLRRGMSIEKIVEFTRLDPDRIYEEARKAKAKKAS